MLGPPRLPTPILMHVEVAEAFGFVFCFVFVFSGKRYF